MKLQVLGVGNAFSPELGNSSIILWDRTKGFLIDCGYMVYPTLKEKNLIDKIDKVFITHRHGDHIGSLDTFIYHKKYLLSQKIKFYGMSAHLEYLKQIDPDFDKKSEEFFSDDNVSINTIPVKHAGDTPASAFYNFGLLYSGDTAESLLETPQAFDAKVILHEVSFSKNSVHANFADLSRAPQQIKSKTWLYHYGVGEDEKFEGRLNTHGFAGFLKKDQVIEF